jgi:lipid-binding SYLF domain-containing protein
MTGLQTRLAAVPLLILAVAPLHAADHELATLESSGEVLQIFTGAHVKGIPPRLMQEATAVAVIPHVVKAGLLFDHRFGRGVLLIHQPNGKWTHPLLITLSGNGVGLEAGVESTDLVLIFKTRTGVDRMLKGKCRLTLGADLAVAAGPLGAEVEATAKGPRKAEICAYSHSRGLFAGLALEGDKLQIDAKGNEAFYHIPGGHPTQVLALRTLPAVPALDHLRAHLGELCGSPPAAVVVTPTPQPHHPH